MSAEIDSDKTQDHERIVLLILAAVQFATILDFMVSTQLNLVEEN